MASRTAGECALFGKSPAMLAQLLAAAAGQGFLQIRLAVETRGEHRPAEALEDARPAVPCCQHAGERVHGRTVHRHRLKCNDLRQLGVVGDGVQHRLQRRVNIGAIDDGRREMTMGVRRRSENRQWQRRLPGMADGEGPSADQPLATVDHPPGQ
jgi:hypothetical protein